MSQSTKKSTDEKKGQSGDEKKVTPYLTSITYGYPIGTEFPKVSDIKDVAVWTGKVLDSLRLNGKMFGGKGGGLEGTLTLAADEYFNGVEVWWDGSKWINTFIITTNKGTLYWYILRFYMLQH